MADETELNRSFKWSVQNGELKEVKTLVSEKKDLLNKVIDGRCAIHYAADYGQTEVVEYLVANGADVNAEDKFGVTPLLSAIFEGHKSTVECLLKKGAKKGTWDGKPYSELAEKDDIRILLK